MLKIVDQISKPTKAMRPPISIILSSRVSSISASGSRTRSTSRSTAGIRSRPTSRSRIGSAARSGHFLKGSRPKMQQNSQVTRLKKLETSSRKFTNFFDKDRTEKNSWEYQFFI